LGKNESEAANVTVSGGIPADDGNRLDQGLGDEQAIERVAVMERQGFDGGRAGR
jgi:hypothetical protein